MNIDMSIADSHMSVPSPIIRSYEQFRATFDVSGLSCLHHDPVRFSIQVRRASRGDAPIDRLHSSIRKFILADRERSVRFAAPHGAGGFTTGARRIAQHIHRGTTNTAGAGRAHRPVASFHDFKLGRSSARGATIYRLPTQHLHAIIEIAGVARSNAAPGRFSSSIRTFSSQVAHGRSSVTGRSISFPRTGE